MKTIYIVSGTTGEYEDRYTWEICGYEDKELAKKHRNLAQKWYDDNGGIKIGKIYDNPLIKNPYDNQMRVDYTGTKWFVSPLKVYSKLRIFKEKKNEE